MSSSAITIIVSLGAINWFIFESMWAKSKLKNGYRIYSAPKGLKLLGLVGIPVFVYGTVANWIENPHEKWVSAILFTMAALFVYFFPPTILLSRQKVISIQWLGFKRVEMNWNDIDAIYSSPENRAVIIQDKNQNRIIHTILNVDRDGFIAELKIASQAASGKITFQL
jgi:hypothetical protein